MGVGIGAALLRQGHVRILPQSALLLSYRGRLPLHASICPTDLDAFSPFRVTGALGPFVALKGLDLAS